MVTNAVTDDERAPFDARVAVVRDAFPELTVQAEATVAHPAGELTHASAHAQLVVVGSRGHGREWPAARIIDAVALLHDVAAGARPALGRRVAVYGGGNTAMDAARVARRLGAEEAVIVYRRTREQMPARAEEADEAEREGVKINWLRTIEALKDPELTVEVMELDDQGRPVPTVTVGVGHGRKAARHINAYLHGLPARSPAKHPVAEFELLNPWYLSDARPQEQDERDPDVRVADFSEVVAGLDATAARIPEATS